jgi:hypothetical protein
MVKSGFSIGWFRQRNKTNALIGRSMIKKNTDNDIKAKWNASEYEAEIRREFLRDFKATPVPDQEILQNLPLFLSRQNLSQILFVDEMYQHILDVHGVIMEFGVRWGRNMALYSSLRGIYEPFNHNRKIIGFDTFEGFPSVDKRDGDDEIISVGAYNVTENYDAYLAKILDYHEQESPISHIKKYEIVKGDASAGINNYLTKHPETIVALAYFDFDIYQPTRDCLLAIKDRLSKGSVIGFDELNDATYPGETLALKETLGIDKHKIRHSRFSPTQSYILIE